MLTETNDAQECEGNRTALEILKDLWRVVGLLSTECWTVHVVVACFDVNKSCLKPEICSEARYLHLNWNSAAGHGFIMNFL